MSDGEAAGFACTSVGGEVTGGTIGVASDGGAAGFACTSAGAVAAPGLSPHRRRARLFFAWTSAGVNVAACPTGEASGGEVASSGCASGGVKVTAGIAGRGSEPSEAGGGIFLAVSPGLL